jgi:hypothetical protein
MTIGIFLTMKEFNRLTDEPSRRKGVRRHKDTMPDHRDVEATDTA